MSTFFFACVVCGDTQGDKEATQLRGVCAPCHAKITAGVKADKAARAKVKALKKSNN